MAVGLVAKGKKPPLKIKRQVYSDSIQPLCCKSQHIVTPSSLDMEAWSGTLCDELGVRTLGGSWKVVYCHFNAFDYNTEPLDNISYNLLPLLPRSNNKLGDWFHASRQPPMFPTAKCSQQAVPRIQIIRQNLTEGNLLQLTALSPQEAPPWE